MNPEVRHTQNFHDWFYMGDYTLVRLYGCPQAPHLLPIFVSDIIEFLEFMW